MVTGIRKVVVPVEDQDAAKEFWTSSLPVFEPRATRTTVPVDGGWKVNAQPDGLRAHLESQTAGRKRPGPAVPRSRRIALVFNCDDIEDTYRALVERRQISVATGSDAFRLVGDVLKIRRAVATPSGEADVLRAEPSELQQGAPPGVLLRV